MLRNNIPFLFPFRCPSSLYFAQPASVLFQLELNKFLVTDFFEIHLEDLGDLRGIYHRFALLFCFVLYAPFYVKRLYTHNETKSLVWNGFNIFLSQRFLLRKGKRLWFELFSTPLTPSG